MIQESFSSRSSLCHCFHLWKICIFSCSFFSSCCFSSFFFLAFSLLTSSSFSSSSAVLISSVFSPDPRRHVQIFQSVATIHAIPTHFSRIIITSLPNYPLHYVLFTSPASHQQRPFINNIYVIRDKIQRLKTEACFFLLN